MSTARRLKSALESIHRSSAVSISSPLGSKRASVAIILRLKPARGTPLPSSTTSAGSSAPRSPPSATLTPAPGSGSTSASAELTSASLVSSQLDSFFAQGWVNAPGTTAEVLYIRRTARTGDRWSGHVAFPGGKREPEDESSSYTAMRETFEEIGLDLAEQDWCEVGALDDREITTSLGKRLLMILSVHVFLHLTPHTPMPELQETEVASAHWIPLELLEDPGAKYGSVAVDISERLAPKNHVAQSVLRWLIGSMYFRCILLPNEPIAVEPELMPPEQVEKHAHDELKLWGLTLGMTLDLLKHIPPPSTPSDSNPAKSSEHAPPAPTISSSRRDRSPLPSSASIFPLFSRPDINALVFLFGWRYRRLLSRTHGPGTSTSTDRTELARKVDWAGMSLGAYYEAVRKALVVAVVARAVLALGGLAALGAWARRKVAQRAARGRLGY